MRHLCPDHVNRLGGDVVKKSSKVVTKNEGRRDEVEQRRDKRDNLNDSFSLFLFKITLAFCESLRIVNLVFVLKND